MGKFYDVDPETCSKEELEAAIANCENKAEYLHTMEQSCKIFINSMYGAMGSSFYSCANKDIAESITLQGQHLIKFSVRVINDYFNNIWPDDIEAHEKVAMYIKERHPDFDVEKFMEMTAKPINKSDTYQVYGDTDSAYMTIQPLIENYPEFDPELVTDFTLGMYNTTLEPHLVMAFDVYAKKFNCPENKQVLELEKIARSTIMLAKKNYIMDIAWVDSGSYIKPLHKVKVTGFDTVKGSTPSFCRTAMKDFIVKMLEKLDNNEMPKYTYIIELIREIKKRFKMQNPDDICKATNITDMEKCILNDRFDGVNDTGVIYRRDPKKPERNITTPIHVRAAAMYNYALSSVGRAYMGKYNFIHSGDKVRYYYCIDDKKDRLYSDDNAPVFAFFQGDFPGEFAPKMDVDMQFAKTILSPLNRIVTALGYKEVPPTLTYSAKLW